MKAGEGTQEKVGKDFREVYCWWRYENGTFWDCCSLQEFHFLIDRMHQSYTSFSLRKCSVNSRGEDWQCILDYHSSALQRTNDCYQHLLGASRLWADDRNSFPNDHYESEKSKEVVWKGKPPKAGSRWRGLSIYKIWTLLEMDKDYRGLIGGLLIISEYSLDSREHIVVHQ